MKKYRVYVTRTYLHDAYIVVEAENKEEAEQKALEDIDDTVMDIKEGITDDDTAEVLEEVK